MINFYTLLVLQLQLTLEFLLFPNCNRNDQNEGANFTTESNLTKSQNCEKEHYTMLIHWNVLTFFIILPEHIKCIWGNKCEDIIIP